MPSRIGHSGERAAIGGIASTKAITPIVTPIEPSEVGSASREPARWTVPT